MTLSVARCSYRNGNMTMKMDKMNSIHDSVYI